MNQAMAELTFRTFLSKWYLEEDVNNKNYQLCPIDDNDKTM